MLTGVEDRPCQPYSPLRRRTTGRNIMLITQLLIASAIVTSTPQPLVVDFPSPSSCPTCPSASVDYFPSAPMAQCPCPTSGMVTSCPVLSFPLPGISCMPDNDCIRKRCLATKGHSTNDMYPTNCLLRPTSHGTYYFRPYNVSTVSRQQSIAQGWGDDPRMPYTTKLFNTLYGQFDQPSQAGQFRYSPAIVLPVSQTSLQMPILAPEQSVASHESTEKRASNHFSPAH